MSRRLERDEIDRQLADLPGWVVLDDALHARYQAPDFRSAVRMLDAVADVAEEMDHHPDMDVRYRLLRFRLSTHSAGGVTQLDVELAHRIAGEARTAGATGVPARALAVEIAVDCVDLEGVAAVWQTALGYELRRGDDGDPYLVDPDTPGHGVWFQPMDPPRTGRNRLHVDVYVPEAETRARLDAVLAAGGRLVTDEHAPRWWVVADPEDNELCICSEDGERDG
jgi:4a-hydroxytetrahydrobiopterin dehydratase